MLKETLIAFFKLQLFSFKRGGKKSQTSNIYTERILKHHLVSKLHTGVALSMFAHGVLKCLENVHILLKGVLALSLDVWIATSISFIADK